MHRTEIDGLRTFALLPVILFHAGISTFSGGFIGVDVFFVISGFLITGNLLRDIENGSYSLVRFYERRARRILPALLMVCFVCIPFAWLWMLPDQFEEFGKSLAATQLFVSNIQFWRETDYFSHSAELNPLLHTWSLAIEEQYYVFFPLLLAGLWKPFGRRRIFWSLVFLALGSLALAHWAAPKWPDATFYLLPSRAWELLAGALCAFIDTRRASKGHSGLGTLGLFLLVVPVVAYSGQEPFPSLWAVPPVLGTALVLMYARTGTLPARFLSLRPMVFIGLISYSAYLWHQPIFAFARLRSLQGPGSVTLTALVLLSLLMGYLSWRFVETPFRSLPDRPRPVLPRPKQVFTVAGLCMSILLCLGSTVSILHGVPERLSPNTLALVQQIDAGQNPFQRDCLYNPQYGRQLPELPNSACVSNPGQNRLKAIILGDSHGNSIAHATRKMLVSAGYQVEQETVMACAPFLGYDKDGWQCQDTTERLLTYVEAANFDLIILALRPHPMLYRAGFDNQEGGKEPLFSSAVTFDRATLGLPSTASNYDSLKAVYTQGLQRLLKPGTPVVLLYPVPEAGWNVPILALKRRMFTPENHEELSTARSLYDARNAPFRTIFDAIERPNLIRMDPAETLCNAERCFNTRNGIPLYVDDDHLSYEGAAIVMSELLQKLKAYSPRFVRETK